jgi:hypothetical protein
VRARLRHARELTLLCAAVGVLLRLGAALAVPPDRLYWDEPSYWSRAQRVLETGDPGTAWQPPAQAYVLAAARAMGGDEPAAGRALNALWFALAAGGLVALAGSWCRALVPVAILALHPVCLAHAGFVLNENLFLALLFWALALQERPGPGARAAAGALWGLAALTREIALPFFALSLAQQGLRAWLGLETWRRAAVLGLAFAATLAPWLIRNAALEGRPVFTTSSGFNLWAGNQSELAPAYSWQSHRLGLYYQHYLGFGASELERDDVARARALAFIGAEQPRWLWRKPWMGLTHLFEPDNYAMRRLRLGHYGPLAPAARRALAVATLLGEALVLAWGIFRLARLPPSPRRNLVVGMLGVAIAIHILSVADARHRLVLELLPLATAGARLAPRAPGRLALAGAALCCVLAIAFLSPGRELLLETLR